MRLSSPICVGKPRQFLVDVDLVGEQRDFLADALVVAADRRLPEPGGEFFLECGDDSGHARRDSGDMLFHRRRPLEQHFPELFALARPRRGELVERGLQQLAACRFQLFDRQRVGAQHAGPVQDIGDAQAGGRRAARSCTLSLSAITCRSRVSLISGTRVVSAVALNDTRHSTLPRLSLRGHQFAQRRFDAAQVFGQPELEVEIAMVDRTQFDVEGAISEFFRRHGVAGHAVYHARARYIIRVIHQNSRR